MRGRPRGWPSSRSKARDSTDVPTPAVTAAPAVSVVVATHNRADRLRALLASLRTQARDRARCGVVVVADGSDDATAAVLAEEEPRGELDLRVLRQDPPAGPAVARDAGWRAARGALIAFTDD